MGINEQRLSKGCKRLTPGRGNVYSLRIKPFSEVTYVTLLYIWFMSSTGVSQDKTSGAFYCARHSAKPTTKVTPHRPSSVKAK